MYVAHSISYLLVGTSPVYCIPTGCCTPTTNLHILQVVLPQLYSTCPQCTHVARPIHIYLISHANYILTVIRTPTTFLLCVEHPHKPYVCPTYNLVCSARPLHFLCMSHEHYTHTVHCTVHTVCRTCLPSTIETIMAHVYGYYIQIKPFRTCTFGIHTAYYVGAVNLNTQRHLSPTPPSPLPLPPLYP